VEAQFNNLNVHRCLMSRHNCLMYMQSDCLDNW